jgi:hypothetical protein
MEHSLRDIRSLRIIGSSFAVIALSFLVITIIAFGYAFILAFEARGRPDQAAISHFAATISRWLMPLLEITLTVIVSMLTTKRMEKNIPIHGLFIGVLTGLLSLAITLSFGRQLNFLSILVFLAIVGSGFLGGIICQKRIDRRTDLAA